MSQDDPIGPNGNEARPAKVTLRPPEWTGARARGGRRSSAPPPPLARREGPEALEWALRARLEVARAQGDREVERASASRLAFWLASRDRGLNEATALAGRALELGEDPELRLELSTWLENLGDAAAAAHVLRPLAASAGTDPADAARVLMRVGVLQARAGNASAASDAFVKAAATHPSDALALEFYGTLTSWAPDVVSSREAAEAYVEAAARRLAQGAVDAQMEDLLRAFDIDPSSSQAVAALAAALTDRSKGLAADEAWRAHAAILVESDPKRAAAVQARRRLHARAAEDLARALGAALDEGLDAHVVGDGADVMDDLLLRVGLLEPLAARLEVRAEATSGSLRAQTLEELARLFAGPLARPDRAAVARVLALTSDPTRPAPLVALRADASATHDWSHLVEALVRAIGTSSAVASFPANDTPDEEEALRAARVAHARTLAAFAEEQLRDSALASWAHGAVLRFDPHDPGALAGLARNAQRWETARREVEAIERSLESARGSERVEPLRTLAGLLASRPDEGVRHAAVLAELVDLERRERRWIAEASRLARRRGDFAEIARLAEEQLARAQSVLDFVEARSALAAALRGLGDVVRANEATKPLLAEAPANRKALALVWVSATLANDTRTRAGAIEQVASACSTQVRAVMLAVAAGDLLGIGEAHAARHLAEQSCQADPSSARSVATLANAALGSHDRTAASALERGINVVFARSAWCWALAEGLEAMGELGYSVGWTQRGVALCPGHRRGIEVLIRRIVRARDGARLADALTWVLSQPHPGGPLAEIVAEPLRDLAGLDPDRAAVIARRALDVCGARSTTLRDAMIDVAEGVRDDAFAAIVLERALAVDFSSDRVDLVLALVRRRDALGDSEGEARALAQAAREGLWSSELDACLSGISGEPLSGDGQIARLEATVEALSLQKDKDATAQVLRELGATLWDLAGDRTGAVRAWLRAAKLVPNGFWVLGMDLARFAGGRYALDCLAELVEKETHDERAGALAAEAARAALVLGEPDRAFALATKAIERNPRLADALETAEKGAVFAGRASEMTWLYDAVANASLGRFGRRAAHYRAARFFDKRSDPGLALKHAANAFNAVPSEGTALILLQRMAERADDPTQALRTIVQVADAASSPTARAGWLLRAATVAGHEEDGLRMRVDVLLRAALLSPQIVTVSLLEQAIVELLRIVPEEKESIDVRLSRAARTVTGKVDGPDGSRIALRFAHMGLEILADDRMAIHALERAMHADADLEEFAELVPYAARLAHAGDDEAREVLAGLVSLTEKPYANVGLPALELLLAMALARGDEGYYARLSVTALEKDPSDAAMLRRADAAVRKNPGSRSGDTLETPASRSEDALQTPGPTLEQRLDKVASGAHRAAVLLAWARERSLEGEHEHAIALLERVGELVGAQERGELQRELVAEYEASGRAEELEERALKDATNEQASTTLRALRWSEVAERREGRGDLMGAVDALLAAARLDPTPIERWSGLERVAELAGAEETRIQAIREIAERVPPEARPAVHSRLARAYAARGDTNAAEATWQAILAADPNDEDADYALEALITARGDYSDLANHLDKRVDRLSRDSGTREALRAVRLRRAAILEQRLSRTQDACDELSRVLDESPDNVSALSYLADLQERMGEYGRAAPLWNRVANLARDVRSQNDAALRAACAAEASKDHANALAWAREILGREPGHKEALDLCVRAARAMRSDRDLGAALEDMAMASSDPGRARSDALLEASAAATRAGQTEAALARARSAAQISPSYAPAQLAARTLEYHSRGTGTPEDARRTVQELSRVEGPLQRDEVALHAFLLAEALDTFQGGGAGLRLLLAKQEDCAGHPVLALGIAERLVAKFDFAGALPYFETALLLDPWDLRDRGRVALAGADAAVRAGEHDVAIRLLEEAAIEGPTRAAALMRAAQLMTSRGESRKATNILEDLAGSTEGEDRARALAQLSRLQRGSPEYQVVARAASTLEAALVAAPTDSALRMQLVAEREAMRGVGVSPVHEWPPGANLPEVPPPSFRPSSVPPSPRPPYVLPTSPPSVFPSSAEPLSSPLPAPPSESVRAVLDPASGSAGYPPGAEPVSARSSSRAREETPDVMALERAARDAVTGEDATAARLALARAHLRKGSVGAAELCLQEGFALGGTEEGDMLAMLLEAEPERTSELVKVRRRLVELVAGDVLRLEDLRRAAVSDKNLSYARAVEHVARSFDPGAGPLPPPALGAQSEQPGFMSLLTQASGDPVAQALACVWEGAPQVFATEEHAMELRGAHRVVTGGSSPIAWVYEAAVRLLDIPRIPLFVRRGSDPVAARVVLTSPPSVLLTGFPNEDNAEVRLALGQGLAGALPTGVLTVGPRPEEARAQWDALLAAFGPPESSRLVGRTSGRLAEALWQALPARTQRRLQTMLSSVTHEDFEPAVSRVRQAGYRVGLFLTGDFGVTGRALLLESSGGPRSASTLVGHGLRHICATQPLIVNLFQLAVSPEYADARWRITPPSSSKVRVSSGRFGGA
jgi:cellulose synthase operon protein C